MIRVFLSQTGETLRTVRERQPDLVVPGAREAVPAARASSLFSARELVTLQLAVESAGHPSFDVVLGGQGTVYMVAGNDVPLAKPAKPAGIEGKSSPFAKAGGSILVVPRRRGFGEALTDALCLLGYTATLLAATGPDALRVELEKKRPEAVIVSCVASSSEEAVPEELRETGKTVAAVLVTTGDARRSSGWDAVASPPLKVRTLVSILDPLIERVRRLR